MSGMFLPHPRQDFPNIWFTTSFIGCGFEYCEKINHTPETFTSYNFGKGWQVGGVLFAGSGSC